MFHSLIHLCFILTQITGHTGPKMSLLIQKWVRPHGTWNQQIWVHFLPILKGIGAIQMQSIRNLFILCQVDSDIFSVVCNHVRQPFKLFLPVQVYPQWWVQEIAFCTRMIFLIPKTTLGPVRIENIRLNCLEVKISFGLHNWLFDIKLSLDVIVFPSTNHKRFDSRSTHQNNVLDILITVDFIIMYKILYNIQFEYQDHCVDFHNNAII